MMDLNRFCIERPYLYHLTDRANIDSILRLKRILSTKVIAEQSSDVAEPLEFLRSRRSQHTDIQLNGVPIKIRDQAPISLAVLGKSLTDSWTSQDFIEHLNARAFLWPTLDRLNRHFNRYQDEQPVIIRVVSSEALRVNSNPLFTNLNSGATRCHPKHNGHAPLRGPHTFLPSGLYTNSVESIAEVTFMNEFHLPSRLWLGSAPQGPWKEYGTTA